MGWREATESIFASAEVGWKSMLYLTVTGRNDWASQLTHSPQASFFYPSVGLSAVITEMLKLPDWVDYLKVPIQLTRMMPISRTGNRRRIIPLVNYTLSVLTHGK